MAQNERWKTGIPVEESSGGERWKSGIPVEPEKPRTRGLLEAVNDNVIEFANAAAGGVSALANMVKPGNAVSGFIDENIIKAGEAKQSDVVRAEKQALGQNLQNAQGIGDELGAVGGYVMNNPLLAASQAAGSFALPGGAVKGAGKAAQVLGAGAKGVETAGRVGGIAAGAAMAGGDAAGTAYELSSNAGATEDQATAAGRQASVIPALVGGVTGAFGAERLLAGAKGFGGNALSRGLKSGLSEAGQEAVEEGVTQFEGQRAAMPYDATIDPTKGVAGAAAMGGIMGFGPGAALGAMGGGPELPSKQMGIDPSAGPLSRAAASAVDSAPPPQLGFSPLAGTPTIYPDGSVTLNGEQDFQKRNPGVQKGMDLSKIAQPSQPLAAERKPAQPEPQPDPVPMESRSLDELRQAFRGAQDPAIRKTLAAEIRKRREAMPDPIAPVQPSLIDQPGEPASVVTPPEPVQASQKEPQAPAAEPAPAVLGQPLTDAGTNLLGRGADPLQSIVAEKNDAVRANNEENGALADDVLNAMREFNPGGEMPSKDDVLRRIAEQGQDKARSTIEMFKTMVADRKGQVEKIEGMYTKSKKGQADEARAKASAPTDTPAATAPAVRSTGVSGVDEQGSVPALKPKEWADRETAPVGSWVKADYKLQDSQPLYQVRELDPKSLFLPELDEKGRLQPEKRKYLAPYAERAKAGEKPPAITVIEMEDGRMRVVDGNRRVMAAIEAGSKNIRALVSPLVVTPDGKKEASVEALSTASPGRPERWRQNALQAGKVARSLGLDPKGKRLAQIVAEIDAKDAGTNVQNAPQGTAAQAAAPAVEASTPAGGNAAAAKAVPAADRGNDFQADGVKSENSLTRPKSPKAAAQFDADMARRIRTGEVTASDAEAAGVSTSITWPAHRAYVFSKAPEMTRREFQIAIKGRHGMAGPEIDAYYESSGGKEPRAQSQPKPESPAEPSKDAGSVSQAETEEPIDSIQVKEGKGALGRGTYLAYVDGDSAPGGPFGTPEQAYAAGVEWKQKTILNAKNSAAEKARWASIADKFRTGADVTAVEIESLGLKTGTSDVRWFFPIAARLFDITSRDIRPLVKGLIRDTFTDMGAKREFVPTRKALEAVAADVVAGEKKAEATIKPSEMYRRLQQLAARANRKPYTPLTEEEFKAVVDAGLATGKKWSTGKLNTEGYGRLAQLEADETESSNARADAEDLIAEGLPFKASAVDQYGLSVPEGYVRQGAMFAKADTAAQAEKPEDDAFMGVKDESPIFYSALRKEIEGLNLKSAPFLGWHGQLQGLVRAGKVKADELEWTGISEWLKLQTGKVSKEDVLAFLDANGVQVTETVLGGSTRTAEFDKFVQKMNDKYGEDWDSNIEQLTEAEFEIYETVPVKPEQSPKYSQYTLPGGENYREVLLTLPAKEQYGIAQRIAEGDKVWVVVDAAGQVAPGTSAFAMEKAAREEARAMNAERGTKAYNSGHWDQPNVLAHIRVNDRVDADGKRVLFVEEIQSDWGQDGKKSGFADRTEKKYTATRKGNWYPGDDSMGKFEVFVDGRSVGFFKANSADYAIAEAQGNSRDMSNRIPAAPFVDKTDKWLALSLKRIMKMAVDGGYDRVAFVNGEQSAERYSLDKQISKVEWITRPVSEKGTNSTPPTDGTLRAWDKNGNSVIDQQMEAADLGDNIGKELAQNLIDMKPSRQTGAGKDVRELAGIDLKVPAKGMRDFYDKIVPAAVKDVLKKVGGGQAEPVAITTNDDGWRITPPDENVHGKWMLKSSDYSSKGELYETEQKAKDAMAEKMGALKQPGFTITEAMREKVAGGLPLFAGSKAKNRGAGTPTDRAIMEMAAEGREANEILSFIAKASKSPYRRLLAQKLLATGANPAVSLGGEMGGGAGFRFLAKYSRKNHEVTLSEDASDRAEQIFLHETTHAATLLALDKGGLMATQMNRLYEQVKANGAAEGQYGLKNVGEFVAEAFTNPEFQKTLKGIKVEGGTVWQRFVNMVRRVLGLESSQQDALSAALDMGAKVMRENMPLRAAKSFRAEDGPAFAGVDQTETPAFKRWFGNSAVLDSAGKPLVVYHGTGAAIDKFRATDGGSLGEGIYFTADPEAASRFAERKGGEMNVMPVFISASRVLDADNITEEQRKAIDAAIPKNADELVSFGFPKAIAEESREFIDRDLKKILSAKRFDPKSLSLAVQGGPASVIEEIYKKAGFDAITRMSDGLIGRPAFREYLAFRPEQIKSATGNNGNFDPNDADIANFGVADAVEQIKQFDVKTAPKNTWAHYRGMAMQALGRRQIVDLYQKEVPQLVEYDQLVQEMDAAKNDSGSKADQLAQDWGKLKDEKALAELMHDATLARIDPSKPMPDGYPKAEFARLKARYDALSPEGKALFGKARDMYKDHYRAVQQAIKDRIERSEMSESQKKKMMASLDEKLFKELEGVYFPLARFGQYVIVVKDGNGEVKNVTRAETVKEAEEARKELMKAFPAAMGNTVGKVLKQAEFNAGRDAVGKGFMADLMGALDEKGVDDELRDTVAQLYLSSLPDLSWAKHGIHRKGTPGFSQDARRAFAQNMFHGARYLAKLRYADQLQDQLSEMQDHVKAYEGVDEYDSIEAQQVVDEMVKRHEILMNPKSSPVSTALTSFGFLFHMGLSPASAMVNLTQTALVAFPQMGAKWGFTKSAAALTKASEEVVRAKNDLSTVLKGDELEAFNQAVKDGTIDVTMAHDLAGIAQGEDQGVMWKVRPVMRWASFMFHHAEKFNRQATFIAAYRLAKEKNPGADARFLYDQAKTATYDGHYDYSSANRPRVMQGNWQRVILLFKAFAQNTIYVLARNAHQSIKGLRPEDRAQARKTLGGILATHAAAAGVLGLPIVGPLLTVASWIGGDDDEPWDAEVAMQNAMAEMLGPKAAEVLARGFSRLTPFDLSGRVALNKLILPDVQEGLEGKEWAESAMAAALGPVAGIGINVARGVQKITEGDYLRGLEDMMPTALRGPLKALRYGSEGAIDKTGVVITDEVSTAGILGQASGFAPSQVRRDTERRSAIYGYDRALLERRSVLMRMMAEARIQGDNETAQEVLKDIQAFNQKHPNRRITPMNIAQSARNRRKRVEEAEQGVYLPKKRKDALDAVSF